MELESITVTTDNGNGTNNHTATALPTNVISNPTIIENGNWRFLIMDSPTDANAHAYVKMLQKKNCLGVVRACDPSYNDSPLKDVGIKVMNLPFSDGDPPPAQVVSKWLDFVEEELGSPQKGPKTAQKQKGRKLIEDPDKKAIAVHCVAGLGRAPVLVCIALVESGMEPYDAISFIRKRRRGAINSRQLQYIENYKPRHVKKCCTIS